MYSRRHLCLFSLAFLSIPACKPQQKVKSAGPPPPVPVSLAKSVQESVPDQIKAVGNVEASSTVQVRSQVAGQLLKAHFEEGQFVQRGELLFSIDARPYEEALRQAEASILRDQAQLRQAEANLARDNAQLRNADAEANRYDELAKAGVIASAQRDQIRTAADTSRESVRAAQAAIESAKAALESDKASVAKAKLDLNYCEIRSPLTGRAGNLLIHPGNLVRANDAPMVVINQVSPIFVSFSVPELRLNEIRRLSGAHSLPVTVSLQDNAQRTTAGRLVVVDNSVDTTTGTIRLKAEVTNADRLLWPGQFVNVVLTLDTIDNATLVPSESVQTGPKGSFIYVVKDNQTVEPRLVATGRQAGRRTIIEKGIEPGETVVVDGQLRLFPGARIRPVESQRISGRPL